MIRLTNGLEFSVLASSGARGWAGRDEGHGVARLWKLPFRWVGCFPPIPYVAKTVTREPRKGNLRTWAPWRSVRRLGGGGLVNAVGLTNPGLTAWVRDYYPRAIAGSLRSRGVPSSLSSRAVDRGVPFFASIAPANPDEAAFMAETLENRCPNLAGIELNLSCPNVGHGPWGTHVDSAVSLFDAVDRNTVHPVIVKLGWQDYYPEICKALDGHAAAFHLINSVPWEHARRYDQGASPLASLGGGGVSGWPIVTFARGALISAVTLRLKTPIISGGGIMNAKEVVDRMRLGASAVSLGTVYLLRPWRVRGIVAAVNRWEKESPTSNPGM